MRYETGEAKGPVFHSSKVFVNFVTVTSLLDGKTGSEDFFSEVRQ